MLVLLFFAYVLQCGSFCLYMFVSMYFLLSPFLSRVIFFTFCRCFFLSEYLSFLTRSLFWVCLAVFKSFLTVRYFFLSVDSSVVLSLLVLSFRGYFVHSFCIYVCVCVCLSVSVCLSFLQSLEVSWSCLYCGVICCVSFVLSVFRLFFCTFLPSICRLIPFHSSFSL